MWKEGMGSKGFVKKRDQKRKESQGKQEKAMKEAECGRKHGKGTKAYKKCMFGEPKGPAPSNKPTIKKKPFEHIDEDAFTGQLDDKG